MRSVMSMILVLASLALHAQGAKSVRLKNVRINYALREYRVNVVVDDRNDKSNIGIASGSGRKDNVVLDGGAASALSKYIADNVRMNEREQPITIHIQQLTVNMRKKGEIWYTNGETNFAFYVGDRKLVEYTGSGEAETDGDPTEQAEQFIRQMLESDLKRFDTWWGRNRDKVPTNTAVKVNVIIARTTDKQHSIVYSPQRPLKIDDFMGPAQHNTGEAAATFSGNMYGYVAKTEHGQLVVTYTITPYFDRSRSWFREDAKDARVLAHEQLHFDITALRTCQFAEKLRSTAFTKDNYMSLLDELQEQHSRETFQLQDQYDTETNHGLIADKQKEWEQKIKDQLRSSGCY